MIGAVLGAVAGLGFVLAAVGLFAGPSFAGRVLPYLDEEWRPPRARWRDAGTSFMRACAEAIGSTAATVAARCEALGTLTPLQFRARQLQWAAGGAILALVCVLASGGAGGLALALVLPALACLGGAVAADVGLKRQVEGKERRLAQELPDVAEFLALSVGAGESVRAGLERVAGMGTGFFVGEIDRILRDVRAGAALTDALARFQGRCGSQPVLRFVDALIASLDRGTSLAGVLHAQAADARSSARRELLEAGGRKEIAMMVPVVFVILPTTVVFTLFPGIAAMSVFT